MFVFFFKQKTAYEVRISDWSSDVCSSDLAGWPFRAFTSEGVSMSQLPQPLKRAELLRDACYIDGKWVGAGGGAGIPVNNPSTGKTIVSVPKLGQIGRASWRERVCQ